MILMGLSAALSGCEKKEKTAAEPVVEEIPEVAFKENMKTATENIGEAASSFKETADQTAREVGGAVKDFGSKLGGVFKKAKTDLEE